jgi:hypothetical protein
MSPAGFFDGKYNTLDGDMATLMLLRDNHTLATSWIWCGTTT